MWSLLDCLWDPIQQIYCLCHPRRGGKSRARERERGRDKGDKGERERESEREREREREGGPSASRTQ